MPGVTTRVLADADVLFSKTLRDWLILLQQESAGGLYEVAWTEDIMAETLTNIRRANPSLGGDKITRIRDLIASSLESGRISHYEIDGTFSGSDVDDQHVHAAAVAGSVDYLVTADGGFTERSVDIDALPYEVHSPDSFFILVDDSSPGCGRAVTAQQRDYWKQRVGKTLPDALRDAGCPSFAERVTHHLCQLAANPQ